MVGHQERRPRVHREASRGRSARNEGDRRGRLARNDRDQRGRPVRSVGAHLRVRAGQARLERAGPRADVKERARRPALPGLGHRVRRRSVVVAPSAS